ncbi:N-6 DNA methylase [Pseudomonas aeruginosa]|uniref:class I SAM-dependent DNA methyltransferase n=1 Tax=Pseudomonas aeruginosa TaxID=287 RepID=UPI00053E314C|nr:N-6 DNA methylase [Pseudomonas aeruginosa]AKF96678.1 SAM-dependent methyltransferase [Pseudomonas aeruginosa]EKN9654589.1 N-6 DNA methylase [Pseudomonas aeruginosa]EKV3034305.1 N-6 DNA methylase [Pseudomonas aeruginosa]EKV3072679.1 N-6 DNA methylase [Pseudomonas aeruginosa]EKW8035939.1 N-6 DNA methylase [Pseudomonas aeruginosa]
MSQVTHDIVQKLWNLCHVLRSDGVTYHQYVTELTYLLFLKMAKETGREDQLPKGYRWDDLETAAARADLDFYRALLIHLGSKDSQGSAITRQIFASAGSFIRKPATLTSLVKAIDELDWYSARQEGLGDLYEGLLEKNAGETKSGAGQYFTPRPLIDSIVKCIKPRLFETIQDPAAGTGGFLIAANHYLAEHADVSGLSVEEFQRYRRQFHGIELVLDTHRLALMNLMLHNLQSDGETGVRFGDTLSPDGEKLPPADLIVSNPPFGTAKGGGLPSRGDLRYPTANKQFAFLQHIYRNLKPGGRAAVVLPDNVLFEAGVGSDIRRDLMDKCNLHTILRLPTGIFYAQGVKTNVLFFQKGSPSDPQQDQGCTQRTWFYDMRSNMPSFGKRTPFGAAQLKPFEEAYGDDPNGNSPRAENVEGVGELSRFRCFTREFIRNERGDSLDISWLKDADSLDSSDLPSPEVLAGEAMAELTEALHELDELMKALGAGDEVLAQKQLLAEMLGLEMVEVQGDE